MYIDYWFYERHAVFIIYNAHVHMDVKFKSRLSGVDLIHSKAIILKHWNEVIRGSVKLSVRDQTF